MTAPTRAREVLGYQLVEYQMGIGGHGRVVGINGEPVVVKGSGVEADPYFASAEEAAAYRTICQLLQAIVQPVYREKEE